MKAKPAALLGFGDTKEPQEVATVALAKSSSPGLIVSCCHSVKILKYILNRRSHIFCLAGNASGGSSASQNVLCSLVGC